MQASAGTADGEKPTWRDVLSAIEEVAASLRAHIPGTADWRRHSLHAIHRAAAARSQVFRRLRTLTSDQKKEFAAEFRRKSVGLAEIEVAAGHMNSFVALLFASLFATSLTWYVGAHPPANFPKMLISHSLEAIAEYFGIAVTVFLVLIARKSRLAIPLAWPLLAPAVIVTAILGSAFLWDPAARFSNLADRHTVLSYLLAGTMAVPIFVAAVTPFNLVSAGYRNRLEHSRPDLLLPDLLFELLTDLESRPAKWQRPTHKRRLLAVLERVAVCLENDVPEETPGGRVSIELWLREAMREKAAGIRDLKKWVLIPNPETLRDLRARTASLFASALKGDLDSFPAAPVPKLTKRGLWLRTVSALWSLIVAALPGGCVWAFAHLGIISGQTYTWAGVASVIWAVSALLVEFDPRFGDRVDAFKRLKAGIGLGKDEEKDKA